MGNAFRSFRRLLRSLVGGSLLLIGCGSTPHPVRMVYDPAWRPLHLLGLEPNLNGYMIELWPAVADRAGMPVALERIGSGLVLRQVLLGEADAGLTTQDPTPELRDHLTFSEPLLHSGTTLVRRREGPAIDPQQLMGVMVGVERDSTAFNDLVTRGTAVFRLYMNPADALEDLNQGHLDAVAMERFPAIAFTRNAYQGRLEVVDPPLNREPGIRLVMRKGDSRFDALWRAFRESETTLLQRRWQLAP